MERIGAHEAKTHLPKLLKRVQRGERITITEHGVPVAVLQPAEPSRTSPSKEVIAELRKLRKRHKLKELPLRDMFEEGRQRAGLFGLAETEDQERARHDAEHIQGGGRPDGTGLPEAGSHD